MSLSSLAKKIAIALVRLIVIGAFALMGAAIAFAVASSTLSPSDFTFYSVLIFGGLFGSMAGIGLLVRKRARAAPR